MRLRSFLTSALLLFATFAAVAFAVWQYIGWYALQSGPNEQPVNLVIAHGTPTRTMIDQLAKTGAIRQPYIFGALAMMQKRTHHLQAGEYAFPAHVTPMDVLTAISEGRVVKRFVTLPEGWTSAQAVAALNAAEAMEGNVETVPAEGMLLPDSYQYMRGDDRAALLARMQNAAEKALAGLWETRSPETPFHTPEEAITLASIVERETALPEERVMVAAVYLNRLRIGMKLQADPTVAYGVAHGALNRPLSHADLLAPNPYNTYVHPGLPPGPICNPGRASLEAVFHPAQTDAIYFVANGRGGHAFAATLEEHNRNVAAWRSARP